MLRSFVENKLQADFFIIEDKEDVRGLDLFISFLKNWGHDNSIKEINLICFENPPAFYSSKQIENDKLIIHNFFSDPCGWNEPSSPKPDLSRLTTDSAKLTGSAIFIDSLSLLAYHHGFFTTCKNLKILKKNSKKVCCVVHRDLFSLEQLEELSFFSSVYIKLEDFSPGDCSKDRICEVTYKKPGGKVIKQKELLQINDGLKVTSRIAETKALSSEVKMDIEHLSTFKLGLKISEEEKKARDELVLPYLKTGNNQTGEIIYQPEADDFEDDPDDDLDI